MRWLMVGLGVLLAGAGAMPATAEDAPPVLTVCEALSDLSKYDGKQVIVVGRLASTFEGAWLDEDCGLKVENGGREFHADISLAYVESWFAPPPSLPNGFKWDENLLKQKLGQVRRTTKLRGYKSYACFGRLETRLPRTLDMGQGRTITLNGYGHLGGSPAQLVGPREGFRALKAK